VCPYPLWKYLGISPLFMGLVWLSEHMVTDSLTSTDWFYNGAMLCFVAGRSETWYLNEYCVLKVLKLMHSSKSKLSATE
jgi:hypothetical protein